MSESSVVPKKNRVIAYLSAISLYSIASILNAKYLEAMMCRRAVQPLARHFAAVSMSLYESKRLALMCRGNFRALLIRRMFRRSQPELAPKHALKFAKVVESRNNVVGVMSCDATHVATLQGHRSIVHSVAFHASLPVFATGSNDNTAKLWRLNSDGSAASCVSTLQGHSDWVNSVAFHASLPFLATCGYDNTAKLW